MGVDAAAFDALYAANADRLYSTAFRLLHDADAAADVVQDAFVKAYTASDEIREPGAWLTTVTRNGALNVLRRGGRLAPLPGESDEAEPTAAEIAADEPAADPVHAAATAEALATLDELLGDLQPAQRTALLLFHAQGEPISSIAGALGRTVNATTVLLHRSRAALRNRYAERVYARTSIPAVCRAFRPELLAHLEGRPVSQAYLDHLAGDPVCQAIEQELRGMGRVLGVLPLIPAPAALHPRLMAAISKATASSGVAATAPEGTAAAPVPAAAATAGGFLSTTAGRVIVALVAIAIVAGGGAFIVFSQPSAAVIATPAPSIAAGGVTPTTQPSPTVALLAGLSSGAPSVIPSPTFEPSSTVAASPTSGADRIVTGRTVDADGRPVEGALVYVQTDQSWGTAIFPSDPERTGADGVYRVNLDAQPICPRPVPCTPGPIDWSADVLVVASVPSSAETWVFIAVGDSPLNVDVVLKWTDVTGIAIQSNGQPCGGSAIEAGEYVKIGQQHTTWAATETDDAGRFTLLLVPARWTVAEYLGTGPPSPGIDVTVHSKPVDIGRLMVPCVGAAAPSQLWW